MVFLPVACEPAMVFGVPLGLSLHLVYFAEAACDMRAFEADLVVVHAVDVANEHVHRCVVSTFGER